MRLALAAPAPARGAQTREDERKALELERTRTRRTEGRPAARSEGPVARQASRGEGPRIRPPFAPWVQGGAGTGWMLDVLRGGQLGPWAAGSSGR
jgi:hypothetical protein